MRALRRTRGRFSSCSCLLAGAGGYLAATGFSSADVSNGGLTTVTTIRRVAVTAAGSSHVRTSGEPRRTAHGPVRQVRYVTQTVPITETVTSTARDTVTRPSPAAGASTMQGAPVSTSTETITHVAATTQTETKRVTVDGVVPRPATVVSTSVVTRTITAPARAAVSVPAAATPDYDHHHHNHHRVDHSYDHDHSDEDDVHGNDGHARVGAGESGDRDRTDDRDRPVDRDGHDEMNPSSQQGDPAGRGFRRRVRPLVDARLSPGATGSNRAPVGVRNGLARRFAAMGAPGIEPGTSRV